MRGNKRLYIWGIKKKKFRNFKIEYFGIPITRESAVVKFSNENRI